MQSSILNRFKKHMSNDKKNYKALNFSIQTNKNKN